MKKIERYELRWTNESDGWLQSDKDPTGEWCKYEDHIKIMADLEQQLNTYKQRYEELSSSVEGLMQRLRVRLSLPSSGSPFERR